MCVSAGNANSGNVINCGSFIGLYRRTVDSISCLSIPAILIDCGTCRVRRANRNSVFPDGKIFVRSDDGGRGVASWVLGSPGRPDPGRKLRLFCAAGADSFQICVL